jgi:type IX secretion system substrate protein
MRYCYALSCFVAACVVLGLTTYYAQAQSPSTIVTFNPNKPGQSIVAPPNDGKVNDGVSFEKAALVTIPQAFVKPTIDGVLDAGEWTDAVALVPGTVPGTGGAGSTVYFKNDACYLYIGAELKGNPSYWGNANMLNIWFDINRNGQWDGANDGVLSLPGPGYLYPPDVASIGYNTLSGWTTCSTCYLRFHYPWNTLGVVLPENIVKTRRINVSTNTFIVEAKIDYMNGPVVLTPGVSFNMRFQHYSGYYTGGGTVQIQAQWPTVSASYYWGSPPTAQSDVQLTNVIAAGNFYDINGVAVADNPVFGSKAFVTGTNMNIAIDYTLNDPPPQTINYRARFYGPFPSTALAAIETGTVTVNNMSGTVLVNIPVNVPIGFYTIEVEADDPEVCGIEPVMDINNALILGPGQIPCSVYPGDVNVDGIVNYGDKKAHNEYIHDANLNPSWLQGYYRLPPSYPKPLSEIEYVGQAALPWNTPEGCHMDTDGNGIVNTHDNVAIKMNWFQTHAMDPSPKQNDKFNLASFALLQNYPNPFNPSTKIDFRVPEKSNVTLTVTDVLGRTVATLVQGSIEAGTHTVDFDASELASGHYVATIQIVGEKSGLSFEKAIKMVLTK